MNVYSKFLSFETVVNIKTKEEFEKFKKRCEELNLGGVKYLSKWSFQMLHENAGIQKYPYGTMCIEYQIGKGFTFGNIKSYRNYGCEVISVDTFLNATE